MDVDDPDLTPPENLGPEQHYHQLLAKGIFALQHCTACAQAIFYPRMVCPHCGGTDLVWRKAQGQGTVYSTTVVRRRPDKGGDSNVVLVDLEEGVRLMSRVEDIAPEKVAIGMRVQSQVRDVAGTPILVFTPIKEAV